ncbi:hypothetical protein QCA50_010455 [Cerrena zonata]|uniref:mRNA decay factor PAT1 domain-containing protein n=1 Tax=Cerrena zonata TaxID=2478898 RepID=A0AAW0FYI5_9APHY
MSFFGFTQANDLEEERRRYLEGPPNGGGQQEDVAVYTWGEESYDGLGDALQEGGDELNDETFGGGGSVGKDFDFAGTTLPEDVRSHQAPRESTSQIVQPVHHSQSYVVEENHRLQPQAAPSSRQAHSLESIWDDKSPFSVLPRTNGSHRSGEHRATPSQNYSSYGNQAHEAHVGQPSAEPLHLGGVHSQGVRTLEEIEAEMRQAAFAAQRNQNISPSQHISQARQTQGRGTPQLQQQQQQRYLQQEVATPPRMHHHAQSPRFHQYHQEQQIQLLEQERLRQLEDSMRQQERIQLMAQMERERERERRREQQLREAQAQQARYLEIQQRQHDRRLAQAQAAAAGWSNDSSYGC